MNGYTFGKRDRPCGDCWDGYCTMNCYRPANENLRPFPAEKLIKEGRKAKARGAIRIGPNPRSA